MGWFSPFRFVRRPFVGEQTTGRNALQLPLAPPNVSVRGIAGINVRASPGPFNTPTFAKQKLRMVDPSVTGAGNVSQTLQISGLTSADYVGGDMTGPQF